jgi:predicted regulator of Ras-like GTPase activity (Roadblock/LC7/MglB family)
MTKADHLARALDEFLATSPDIEAAAVVSADGLPMASALPPHVEEDRLAAMSAAILTLGERASFGLGKGGLQQVFVEGEYGYVVLMAAGENAVLVAVTSQGAKVGLLLFEMRRASSRVATVMDEVAVVVPPAPPEVQTPAPVVAPVAVAPAPTPAPEPVAMVEEDEHEDDEHEPVSTLSEVASIPTFVSSDSRPPAPVEFEPGNAW